MLSKAKSLPASASRSSSWRNKRPAANAANSGRNGESPVAIKSGLTKWITAASLAKNSRAKVVFPAPLGPAMMMHLGDKSPCLFMGAILSTAAYITQLLAPTIQPIRQASHPCFMTRLVSPAPDRNLCPQLPLVRFCGPTFSIVRRMAIRPSARVFLRISSQLAGSPRI